MIIVYFGKNGDYTILTIYQYEQYKISIGDKIYIKKCVQSPDINIYLGKVNKIENINMKEATKRMVILDDHIFTYDNLIIKKA